MAQTILLKRRTADATAPVANDLTTGEIAVNAYSGKLYVKKTDGSVAEISGSGGDAGLFRVLPLNVLSIQLLMVKLLFLEMTMVLSL